MIDTKLHNGLIDEDAKQRIISAKIDTTLLKRELLKERLKNYAYILIFIFLVLMLFGMLFRLFSFFGIFGFRTLGFKGGFSPLHTQTQTTIQKPTPSKQNPYDGIDYIKKEHFIYKREWKDGELIKETKLAPTIKESRQKEKIPQFSAPKK